MTNFDDTTHPPRGRQTYFLTVGPRKPKLGARLAYGTYHISTSPPYVEHQPGETPTTAYPEEDLRALCGTPDPQTTRRGPLDAADALLQMVGTPSQWRCPTCWDEIIREKHPTLRRSSR